MQLPSPDDLPTDALTAEQARQNRTTRSQWLLYGSHRRRIERLIVPAERGRERICILGAGNCNDLDLKWLAEVYREVHLVDLDAGALEGAVRRQGVEQLASIRRHAPVDLTGIAPRVAEWSSGAPAVAEIEAATRSLLEAPPPLIGDGRFDLVLSPCVLTQLMNPIRDAMRHRYPPSHPMRVAMREALRLRHLRTLAANLAAGGRAVLVIDLISTDRFADLARIPQDRLDDFMRTFIADGKHYGGLDPASVVAAWRSDARRLGRELAEPRFSTPWLWHLGLRKSFVVYAATFWR
jgi:hypothetical protein